MAYSYYIFTRIALKYEFNCEIYFLNLEKYNLPFKWFGFSMTYKLNIFDKYF